jgi:thiamine-monophosphate kinase
VNEFDLIAAHLAPLAESPGALGLKDDVAFLQARGDLVLTADAMVEGVHFLPDDPLDTVARKLVRVNLSDLIAKGAAPVGGLLTLSWPRDRPTSDIADFARGLAAERENGFALLGGDTVSTPGPLTLSLTMIGQPLSKRGPILRSGAKAGDLVAVTGVIGDGALGLMARLGRLAAVSREDIAALEHAYRIPDVPIGVEHAVAMHASASLDVSDGLLADAAHLARCSGLRIEIDADAVPLSPAGKRWMATTSDRSDALAQLLAGGDDYQTLFAAPAARIDAMRALAPGVAITVIGHCVPGEGAVARRADGALLAAPTAGWSHF